MSNAQAEVMTLPLQMDPEAVRCKLSDYRSRLAAQQGLCWVEAISA